MTEGRVALDRRVQQDAERPQVGLGPGRATERPLRGEELGRTDDLARHRQRRTALDRGDTEVVRTTRPSFDSSTLAGFTSRCSTRLVRGPRRKRLGADVGGALRRLRALGVQQVGQGDATDEFHDDQGRPSCVATSYTVTTLRFATRAAAHASRSSRAYIRSTSCAGSRRARGPP